MTLLSSNKQCFSLLILLLFVTCEWNLDQKLAEVHIERFGVIVESSVVLRTEGRKRIHSFLGIPYGTSQRFEKPAFIRDDVERVFHADKWVDCVQLGHLNILNAFGTENCLAVNVYTTFLPKRLSNIAVLQPVMVFIHGGFFSSGSGSPRVFGPDYLMEEDVVFVGVNYRLGPLGFLGMNDDVLQGNLGLWDQRLAFIWVKKHIHLFGGDKDRVTLVGHSSGAFCVFAHLASPQSKGLFHAAIIQSGFGTLPFGHSDHHPSHYARKLANTVGCDSSTGSSAELKSCLLEIDARELAVEANELSREYKSMFYSFKPHLDNSTSDQFFPKDPFELIKTGDFNHVPVLMGSTEDEGLIFSTFVLKFPELYSLFARQWNTSLPMFLFNRESDAITKEDTEYAHEIVKDLYGTDFPRGSQNLTRFFTSVVFQPLNSLGVSMLASANVKPVFEYRYSHQGSVSLADIISHNGAQLAIKLLARMFFGLDVYSKKSGVCHGDELFLLFKPHVFGIDTRITHEDKAISKSLVKMWTTFVKSHELDENLFQEEAISSLENSDGKMAFRIGRKYSENSPKESDLDTSKKWWEKVWKKRSPSLHKYDSPTWKEMGTF